MDELGYRAYFMNAHDHVCGGINKPLIIPFKTEYQISPQFINNMKIKVTFTKCMNIKYDMKQ